MAVEVWKWSTYVERVRILGTKKLGSGSSANVYEAELDGTLVAAKVYKINTHGVEYAREACVEEAKMHAYLQQQSVKKYNEYVVPLLLSFCVPARDLYINVFACGTQSLYRYVHRCDLERMAQGDAVSIMHQVLKGVAWLHSCGVAHCDLSTGNIVQTRDGQWRIIDLGACKMMKGAPCVQACRCDRVTCRMNDQYVCSRWYRSPEVILRTHAPGYHMDVWSAGCMLAEMLLGRPIFTGINAIQVMQMIVAYIGLPPLDLLQQTTATYMLNDHRLHPPSWICDEYFCIDKHGVVQFNCQFTTEECVGVQHEALLNPRFKQLLGSMLCYIDTRKTAQECVEYINNAFYEHQ